jgi:hypothetical protein
VFSTPHGSKIEIIQIQFLTPYGNKTNHVKTKPEYDPVRYPKIVWPSAIQGSKVVQGPEINASKQKLDEYRNDAALHSRVISALKRIQSTKELGAIVRKKRKSKKLSH